MNTMINVVIIIWSIAIIVPVVILVWVNLKDLEDSRENNCAFKNKKQDNEIVTNWTNALALSRVKDSYVWLNVDGKYFHVYMQSTKGIDVNRPRKLYVDGILIAIL